MKIVLSQKFFDFIQWNGAESIEPKLEIHDYLENLKHSRVIDVISMNEVEQY
jgi:hypothetical protein